eukprot:8780545-Karenia_brevis.AAC.1
MTFHDANVQNPLVAVTRIVENGNSVAFGPNSEDNFILNVGSGEKLMLTPNGRGAYLMEVNFANGERIQIVVDSGAEKS